MRQHRVETFLIAGDEITGTSAVLPSIRSGQGRRGRLCNLSPCNPIYLAHNSNGLAICAGLSRADVLPSLGFFMHLWSAAASMGTGGPARGSLGFDGFTHVSGIRTLLAGGPRFFCMWSGTL